VLVPARYSRTDLDIGGPDIITYRDLLNIYARLRGLRRLVIAVPFVSPVLSSYWINLVTRVPAGIVMPLVEGSKTRLSAGINALLELVTIRLLSMKEASVMLWQNWNNSRGSQYPDSVFLAVGVLNHGMSDVGCRI